MYIIINIGVTYYRKHVYNKDKTKPHTDFKILEIPLLHTHLDIHFSHDR